MRSDDLHSNRSSEAFVGRRRELEWLFDRFQGRGQSVVISGPGRVGKTSLLNHFLTAVRSRPPALVLTASDIQGEPMIEIRERIDQLYRDRDSTEIVAIDDAEVLDESQLDFISRRVLNLKRIRILLFVTRRQPEITRADVLNLRPLSEADARSFLQILLGTELSAELLSQAVKAAGGLPLALTLIAGLLRQQDHPQEVLTRLQGKIYDFKRQLILPENKLIPEIKPRIILANEAVIERLRREPSALYDLPQRKFEELVAELLKDLGYEVELTPQTRDGGKDILAYMPTPHGKLLCLVEAKKYRRDRRVGVELVRELYGTLTDADATSAMLVTTSSFSQDARAFQSRHQYKLALRDYSNVVRWIDGYKKTRQ